MHYTPNCEIKPGMMVPEDVSRWMLVVEYNGAAYRGFQKQASTPITVQSALEQAISSIAAQPLTLICAGRTDAGVHATRQVVHFDTTAQRPSKAWREGVNTQLPDTIRVQYARQVPLSFHARFSAQARTYRYIMCCDSVRPAILADFVTWFRFPLDEGAMREASQLLVGEHDFSAFRSSQCQARSPVRRIESIRWKPQGRLLVMEVTANAFLHHMVRNIVGALYEIGRGARSRDWLSEVLAGADRTRNAATAPAYGLHLVGVEYDPEFEVPSAPHGPIFVTTFDR